MTREDRKRDFDNHVVPEEVSVAIELASQQHKKAKMDQERCGIHVSPGWRLGQHSAFLEQQGSDKMMSRTSVRVQASFAERQSPLSAHGIQVGGRIFLEIEEFSQGQSWILVLCIDGS